MKMSTGTDVTVDDRIRAHIRHQMHDRDITKSELAGRLGVSHTYIGRILTGERGEKLSASMAERLSRALSVTPSRLLQEDPPAQFFREGSEAR